MVLLQADVTANTAEHAALLKRFRLFGPPGIVFFDRGGREIQGLRVIGFQPAERFRGRARPGSALDCDLGPRCSGVAGRDVIADVRVASPLATVAS